MYTGNEDHEETFFRVLIYLFNNSVVLSQGRFYSPGEFVSVWRLSWFPHLGEEGSSTCIL